MTPEGMAYFNGLVRRRADLIARLCIAHLVLFDLHRSVTRF